MKTTEEKKIARLEKQVRDLKEENCRLREDAVRSENSAYYERQWRMDFQRLMKAASLEDSLQDYNRYQ